MDHWLNNAPGLIFLKELSTWFILNHKCEPVIWIEGESELGWYFGCVPLVVEKGKGVFSRYPKNNWLMG